MSSSSQMRSCTTSSAWPSIVTSNDSSPSRLVREGQTVAEKGQSARVKHSELTSFTMTLKHVQICLNSKVYKHKLQHISFLPPVALAIRLRSFLRTLLTAMAPASTKYFRHMSSMPPVVSITFAPAAKIFWILSLVISDSLNQTNKSYIVSTSPQMSHQKLDQTIQSSATAATNRLETQLKQQPV